LSFFQGNVIKYVVRYKDKNGIEDIRKIIHYCELEIESLENEKENTY
jgi:arsenate reductase-like glutaredoxin family protein